MYNPGFLHVSFASNFKVTISVTSPKVQYLLEYILSLNVMKTSTTANNQSTNQPIKFSVGPSVGNAHCFDCVLKADSRALMLSHTVVTCWSLMGQLNLYTPPQLLQVVASAGDKLFHLLNTRGL